MLLDFSTPSPKHTPARMVLNADLTELVKTLDATAAQVRRLIVRVPAELNDEDFNDVMIEDLTRLRLNLREASGVITPFLIPVKKTPAASPVVLGEGAGQ